MQPIDFAGGAQAMGATSFTVEDPAQCGAILDQALATPGPVVVEAVVNPNESPKVNLEQTLPLAAALAKGTPNNQKLALPIFGDRVHELV